MLHMTYENTAPELLKRRIESKAQLIFALKLNKEQIELLELYLQWYGYNAQQDGILLGKEMLREDLNNLLTNKE